MTEKELKALEIQIRMSLENCACLGRDAYGRYIDNLTASILEKIKSNKS
jgi:hypothetical protein